MRAIRVFIASSSENREVTEAVADMLRNEVRFDIQPAPWHLGTFKLSQTYIESLEGELDKAAFAVLVLTPNDIAYIREQKHEIPRDNVLFELGLFMGRLGRDHCFLLHSQKQTKLPSDLLGLNVATYSEANPLTVSLRDATADILNRIAELEQQRMSAFCALFSGYWWERIHTKNGREISFFHAIADETLTQLQFVDGQHFSAKGKKIGDWKSVLVGYDEAKHELIYSWKGRHYPKEDGSSFKVQGYGTIELVPIPGQYKTGNGGFIDVDTNQISSAQWKSVDFLRAVRDDQVHTMTESSESKRGVLAKDVLDNW